MSKTYKIMFVFSIAITIAAALMVVIFGLKFGVDFVGGSILELNFGHRPDIAAVSKTLKTTFPNLDISSSPVGDSGLLVRTTQLSEPDHQLFLSTLKKEFPNSGVAEKRFDSVGPVIGQELRSKSILAVILVIIAVIIYITFVFRRLSGVLPMWGMGVATIAAMIHDVTIPLGVFALLGRYANVEVTAIFVAAILTILGYSISDTVVVFDRVRENLIRSGFKEPLGALVHRSIMQTLTRSLNTAFTAILSLVAIFFFGGESIHYFALALIIGIVSGSYSSIFVASPLLVLWANRRKKS